MEGEETEGWKRKEGGGGRLLFWLLFLSYRLKRPDRKTTGVWLGRTHTPERDCAMRINRLLWSKSIQLINRGIRYAAVVKEEGGMAMCCRLLLPWKLGRGWVQQPLRVSQCDAVCVRYFIFFPPSHSYFLCITWPVWWNQGYAGLVRKRRSRLVSNMAKVKKMYQ